jgi:hypothetical protein
MLEAVDAHARDRPGTAGRDPARLTRPAAAGACTLLAPLLAGLVLGCRTAPPSPTPTGVRDLEGSPVDTLATRGAAVSVLVFTRTDCPISNRYAPEVNRLHRELGPRGVAFWLVYVDRDEPTEDIRRHVALYAYACPAVRDGDHALVALTGARVTPEAAVFVGRRMVYRGRIDDRVQDFGKERAAPSRRDLELAILAALDGRPVDPATTRAVGCFIADLQ